MRCVTLAATLSLVTAVSVSSVQAASPTLRLVPAYGPGALTSGAWQPMTVVVTAAAALSGELVVEVSERARATTTTYTRPVTVPQGGGEARVTLPLFIEGDVPFLSVTLRDARGRALAQGHDFFPTQGGNRRLQVLAVTESGDEAALREIQGQELGVARLWGTLHQARAPKPVQRISVVPATPGQLSERVWDYGSFGILYLGSGVDLAKLSEGQRAALWTFVRQGGLLVLNCAGVATFTEDFESATEGTLVHRAGFGAVVTTESPLNLDTWKELALLGVGPVRATQAGWWSSCLSEAVLRGDSVGAPPFGKVAFFLGLYLLVVVPGQYLILRRLDKREWAWGTTPLLACGFAVAAYQLGSQGRSTAAYHNLASVVELGANQSEATAVAAVGLYSPTRSTYRLVIAHPETLYRPAEVKTVSRQGLTVAEEQGGQVRAVQDLPVAQWAMRSVMAETTLTLGKGVEATLTRQGDRVVGVVTNRTGHTLREAVLATPSGYLVLGELPQGKRCQISLAAPRWNPGSELPYLALERPARHLLSAGCDELLHALRSHEGDPEEALLLAVNQDELLPVELNGKRSPAKSTVNLVMAHLAIQPEK